MILSFQPKNCFTVIPEACRHFLNARSMQAMAHRLLQRRTIVIAVDDNDLLYGVWSLCHKIVDSLQRILYIKSVNINRKGRVGFGHNGFKKQNCENTKKNGDVPFSTFKSKDWVKIFCILISQPYIPNSRKLYKSHFPVLIFLVLQQIGTPLSL